MITATSFFVWKPGENSYGGQEQVPHASIRSKRTIGKLPVLPHLISKTSLPHQWQTALKTTSWSCIANAWRVKRHECAKFRSRTRGRFQHSAEIPIHQATKHGGLIRRRCFRSVFKFSGRNHFNVFPWHLIKGRPISCVLHWRYRTSWPVIQFLGETVRHLQHGWPH